MHSLARCRPRRIRPIAYADTFHSQAVSSGSGIRAEAGIAEGQPRRARRLAEARRSGPGSGRGDGSPKPLGSGASPRTKVVIPLPGGGSETTAEEP